MGGEESLRQTGSQPESSESVCGLECGDGGSAKEILQSHSGVGCSFHSMASLECTADVDAIVSAGSYD